MLVFSPDTLACVYYLVVEKICKQISSFLLDLNTFETVMTSFGYKISELREKLRISISKWPIIPNWPILPNLTGMWKKNQKQDKFHNFNEQSSKSTNVFEVIIKIINCIFFFYMKLFLGFIFFIWMYLHLPKPLTYYFVT